MSKDKVTVILGIDPGSTIMGYSIISVRKKELTLESMGVIRLEKYKSHYKRLHIIHDKTVKLIEHYHPTEVAIEAPFYGKNVQSMLKLGRAQGVAIAAALQFELPVEEYAPRRIKQAITGNGNASKEQVAGMLHHLIEFDGSPSFTDASDALATAICHHLTCKNPLGKSKAGKGWSQFLRDNPDRIR